VKDLLANAGDDKAARYISRLFSTLQHRKTADTLRKEGVDVLSLITNEIRASSIPKIQRACEFQIPRLVKQEEDAGKDPQASFRKLPTPNAREPSGPPGPT
jgi:hypothetical protein